jgi:hypothetical protein
VFILSETGNRGGDDRKAPQSGYYGLPLAIPESFARTSSQ